MRRTNFSRRRSIRLQEFDYAQNGAYFVTICAIQHICLFGDIQDGELHVSPVGQVVNLAWQDLPEHTAGLVLDAWVLMPNHLHGIIILSGNSDAESPGDGLPRGPKPGSLGAVIGGFKSAVSRSVTLKNLPPVRPIWQRNYHERVIRNDRELDSIRRYVADNPVRWRDDPDHPRFHPDPAITHRL